MFAFYSHIVSFSHPFTGWTSLVSLSELHFAGSQAQSNPRLKFSLSSIKCVVILARPGSSWEIHWFFQALLTQENLQAAKQIPKSNYVIRCQLVPTKRPGSNKGPCVAVFDMSFETCRCDKSTRKTATSPGAPKGSAPLRANPIPLPA